MGIGERMKQARKSKHISRKKMAEITGMHEPSDLIRRTDVLRILDNLYEDAWQSLPGISKSARLSALGYAIDLVKELPEHKGE